MNLKVNATFKADTKNYNKVVRSLQMLAKKKAVVKFDPVKIYESTGEQVDQVAVWMEYGSDEFKVNYPPRPFWRKALKEHTDDIQRRFNNNVMQVAQGKMTPEQCFEDLAKQLIAYIKKSIASGNFPPLAPSTVAKRELEGKDDTPLMDTLLLINSLVYEVM